MDWKTLTSLGRFKDIIMVLLRYGFDDLVDRLNIPGTTFMRKKVPSTIRWTPLKGSDPPAKSWARPLSSSGRWRVCGRTWCRRR
jgi:hypothetical protein